MEFRAKWFSTPFHSVNDKHRCRPSKLLIWLMDISSPLNIHMGWLLRHNQPPGVPRMQLQPCMWPPIKRSRSYRGWEMHLYNIQSRIVVMAARKTVVQAAFLIIIQDYLFTCYLRTF